MSTRKRPDEDFAREIGVHLELETERLVDEGMTPDEARAQARRSFGNVTLARERFYERGRRLWLDRLRQDVRCAARNMRRAPVVNLVAVASLAAGIGATTVTLAVREVLFYKPPPLYHDPERLSRIQVAPAERPIFPLGSPVPVGLFMEWRGALGPAMGGTMAAPGVQDVRTENRSDAAPLRTVTPGFFALLGVAAHIGNADVDAQPGAAPRAVLSYGLWQRLYDGRADVIGRTIWIERQPHTIAGVMPERFWLSEMNSPIWTVLDPRARAPGDAMEVVVRRPPDMPPAALEARLTSGLQDFAQRLPSGQRHLRMRVSSVGGTPMGHMMSFVLPYVLGTAVMLTLLIACANVAILLIAQWSAREHETAIRASIGASRGRIVRSLLTEAVMIAACGALLGVAATLALRGLMVARGGAAMHFFNLSIDPGVFVKTAIVALFTGVVAGIAPALYETRRLHTNPLRAIAGSERVRQRWRSALVVLEITVTVALLVETAAMVDGYLRARRGQVGYDTRPLLIARVENPAGVPTSEVASVLTRLPGVAAASAATTLPYATVGQRVRAGTDGSGADAVPSERSSIRWDYFSTLGVQIHAGRAFEANDAGQVIIINEALARRLFPNRDAIGSRVWIGDDAYDVVGIVADYASNPFQQRELGPKLYLPLPDRAASIGRLNFLIRAEGDPAPLTQTVRREIGEALTGTSVTQAHTIDQMFDVWGQEIMLGTAPLFPLIAIGLLLTMAGIYGVLTFAITRRSRELAVRVAVGASGRHVIALVAGQTLRLILVGSAAGIAVTFSLSRVVRAGGGAGSIYDPPLHAFVWPVLIVLALGALATWIPSRRALKIDPSALLRTT
jgi:predicted permease